MTELATDKYKIILEYDASNRLEYVKKAKPDSKTDKAVWQIVKIFYDGTSQRVLSLGYANNSSLFQFIADDYLSYKYTEIKTTVIVPLKKLTPSYVFDLTTGSDDYTLEGDEADLLVSEELFNNADFITVKEGNRVFDKGITAIWQSQTTIKFNDSSEKDVSIIIVS
ncbi:MAG: hypothetical protein B7C24_16605 [Bacteroidetes bacterium 4572_77]|nr:MAG: hypothetical protein B7C24_16605 [Bacteroidetes bacterium 4572_77]